MYESFISVLVLLVVYCPSPAYYVVLVCNLVLYFYQYILTNDLFGSVSLVIGFLNKLNSASINPVIFWTIILWISARYYYKAHSLNTATISGFALFMLPACICSENSNLVHINLAYVKIEPTLTNGLLIIHPIMLYVFYGAVVYLWGLCVSYASSQVPLSRSICKSYLYQSQPWVYLTGAIALGLGSWWSYQELNWGGFWSWDLVEIFLLVSVLYAAAKQHLVISTQFTHAWSVFFVLNFVIYIYSVRYNLINSIHNFISQSNFSYKITYLIVLYLAIVISLSYVYKFRVATRTVSHKYQYPLLLLEGAYIILVGYVIITYLSFYLFSSSSLLLINAVPLLLNTLGVILLVRYVSVVGFILPLVESLLLGCLWSVKVKMGFNWAMHYLVFVLLGSLVLWYSIILLAQTSVHEHVLSLVSYSTSAVVMSSQQSWDWWYKDELVESNLLYLGTMNPKSLAASIYGLVVYALPTLGEGFSSILFSHKCFAKISFVESQVLIFLILTFIFISYSGNRKPILF